MAIDSISRRNLLKSLSAAALTGSVLQTIPLGAAETVHRMVQEEKAAAKTAAYTPKFFPQHQYKTLQCLCEAIFPADADCGGAIEAGAPEFIDLLTSENSAYQVRLGGGIMWLDSACADRYGQAYLGCTPEQQAAMLDLISHRSSVEHDAGLAQGVVFFAFLRNLAADGFFTSKIGIEYLGYKGNSFLTDFPGCPPVPGV